MPDLKVDDYGFGPLDNVYRIVYKFELVYSFQVVYKVVTKLSLCDRMPTLVAVLPHLAYPYPTLSKSEV